MHKLFRMMTRKFALFACLALLACPHGGAALQPIHGRGPAAVSTGRGVIAGWKSQQLHGRVHREPYLPSRSFQLMGFNKSPPAASASSASSSALEMWSGEDELEGPDRIKACFPYILPLLDGDQFGYFIYQRIPPLGYLDDILLGPLLNIYHAVPFLGLLLFLALTLGTRGSDMSRGVRFNAQQAALIDVALVFPELIASAFEEDPLPRAIAEPSANFIYYMYMSMVVYSIYSNLRGKKPNQIPWISGYSELMVGPF